MGPNILLMVAASLLIVASATGHGAVGNEVFHVTGRVLCQDCSKGWKEWIHGANPIKGCKVSVTCLDDRNRVVQYASDLTDDAGDFDISCNKFMNGKELDPKNCVLRLVSSPDPVCNIATDFAGGKSGVKLHRPTEVYRDILKYVLGPFYYTTPMCDEPDTSVPENTDEDESKQDNKYTDEDESKQDDKYKGAPEKNDDDDDEANQDNKY